MTEEKVVVSPEQEYFNQVLAKFNENPQDEALTEPERVLLEKIKTTQKEMSELATEFETLNKEVAERQERGAQLAQRMAHLQGRSQGYVDSLLALR